MSLKILVINWQDITNPLGGGAEVHFHEIFKRIAQKGHQVTLLCCRYQNAKSIEFIDDIRIVRIGNRNLFNFYVPRSYFRLLKETDFDIVIDDINKIPFYTPLYVKKPLVGIIHHLFGKSIFLEASLPIAYFVNLSEKLIPPVYRKIPMAVVSESTKNELISKGFNKDKIHIIYNGVDLLAYKALFDKRASTPIIGYFGRIKKYKSVDHILNAFKIVLEKFPHAKLRIMGAGDYLPELEKLSRSLSIEDAITFTGILNPEIKLQYLNEVWLTVNPSPKEGWGLTVIESNACGVPVIAANSPGLRDSVVHNVTGLLYNYGDIEQLAEQILKLITQDNLRQQLSVNCLEWVKNFNWDKSADNMLNLIEHTIHTEDTECEPKNN